MANATDSAGMRPSSPAAIASSMQRPTCSTPRLNCLFDHASDERRARGSAAKLREVDAQEFLMLLHVPDTYVEERAQAVLERGRGRHGVDRLGRERFEIGFKNAGKDRLLRQKVEIDGALGDAGRLGDLLDVGGRISPLRKQPAGGTQDFGLMPFDKHSLPRLLAVPAPRSR